MLSEVKLRMNAAYIPKLLRNGRDFIIQTIVKTNKKEVKQYILAST